MQSGTTYWIAIYGVCKGQRKGSDLVDVLPPKQAKTSPLGMRLFWPLSRWRFLIEIVLVTYKSCPLCTRHEVVNGIDIHGIAFDSQCSFDNALLAASHLTSLTPMTPARRQWLTLFDDFIYLT